MKDNLDKLYNDMLEEKVRPLNVPKSASGNGQTGGLTPGDLPADTGSTTAQQSGTGASKVSLKTPEEADSKLSPYKPKKSKKKSKKGNVMEKHKSFMELFDQVMVNEAEDIESPEYNDEMGDFPQRSGEGPLPDEGDEEMGGEMSEGEIYQQLSDLFSQLAELKGGAPAEDEEFGEEEGMGPEGAPPDEYGQGGMPQQESTIAEMRSAPVPSKCTANSRKRMMPTSLSGKGVRVSSKKKKTGSSRQRTGVPEGGPKTTRMDKSKFKVKGSGPAHTANNASALED